MQGTSVSFKNLDDLEIALTTPGLEELVWDLTDYFETDLSNKIALELKQWLILLRDNQIKLERLVVLHPNLTFQYQALEKHPESAQFLRYLTTITNTWNTGNIIFRDQDRVTQDVVFKPTTQLAIAPSVIHTETATFKTLDELFKLTNANPKLKHITWDCRQGNQLFTDAKIVAGKLDYLGNKTSLTIKHSNRELQRAIDEGTESSTPGLDEFIESLDDFDLKIKFEFAEKEQYKPQEPEFKVPFPTKRKATDNPEEQPTPKRQKPALVRTEGTIVYIKKLPQDNIQKPFYKPDIKIALKLEEDLGNQEYYQWKHSFLARHLIAKNSTYLEKGWITPFIYPWAKMIDFALDYLTDNDIKHTKRPLHHTSYTPSNQAFELLSGEIKCEVNHAFQYICESQIGHLHNLTALYLPKLNLGDDIITNLVQRLQKETRYLEQLDLSHNLLTHKSSGIIGNSITKRKEFIYLNLSYNPLGAQGILALIHGTLNGDHLLGGGLYDLVEIHYLDLSYTLIGSQTSTSLSCKAMRHLGKGCTKFTPRSLILEGNSISDAMLDHFFNPILSNALEYTDDLRTNLAALYLDNNNLCEPKPLLKAVSMNRLIYSLSINDNPLNTSFCVHLCNLAFNNESFVALECRSTFAYTSPVDYFTDLHHMRAFLKSKGDNPCIHLLKFECSLHISAVPGNIKAAIEENRNRVAALCEVSSAIGYDELPDSDAVRLGQIVATCKHSPINSFLNDWSNVVIIPIIGTKQYSTFE